jgi:hypothetical protein
MQLQEQSELSAAAYQLTQLESFGIGAGRYD